MQKFVLSFLLSVPGAAQAHAITFPDRNSFTAVSKVSSGQIAATARFTLDVGDTILVHVAKDNVSSDDGETNEILNVVDSLNNTYENIMELSNGQSKRQAGVVAAMFLATNSAAISNAPFSVTVHFSTNNAVC